MYTQFNDQSQCFLQKHTGVFYIIRILIPLIGISFFVTGKASYCVRRDILPQNMTYYHKKRHITTKHDTLSQKTHYHKSDILPQNMTHYHNTWHITTKRDTLLQNMTYYHKSDTLPQNILPQNVTHYHKSDILPQNVKDYLKTWQITIQRDMLPQNVTFYHKN